MSVFRSLTALFLSATLVLPWMSKVAITIDFVIHQEDIAKTLCENRDKPELHCNGKCVLMQKLQLSEETPQKPNQIPEILRLEVSSFVLSSFIFDSTGRLLPAHTSSFPFDKERSASDAFLRDVFHPPRLLS